MVIMGTYEEIKDKCLRYKRLWEDPEFPASNDSIRPGLQIEECQWKRPRELSRFQPKFIIQGATRFDIGQGELGDCWFVASAAALATKPDLFAQVVPPNQNFVTNYIGAFRFNFWHFGAWKEVVVDDRLPVTEEGKLIYVRNRTQHDEFWAPLLEKAYAKLYGCYDAIADGHVRDALVDLTGGLSEPYNLRRDEGVPDDLFDTIHKSYQAGSLAGALIWNDTGKTQEEEMWNGLYKGHIYSITSVIEARIQGWPMKLIRMRNPWGKGEWTGPWSDKSDEWKSVPDDVKKEINLVIQDDGEFWIRYEDVLKNFSMLDIVHLGPETFARLSVPKDSVKWHCVQHHGAWVKGVNAGGNGFLSPQRLYYRNPQYFVTLKSPDKDALNITKECTMIVSLLLKDYRQRKFSRALRKLIVGFDVHLLKSGNPEILEGVTFEERTILKKKFATRTAVREVTARLSLDPGTYVIIPNTFKADQEATFLLRCFTYSPADSVEVDHETGPVVEEENTPKARAKPIGIISSELFTECAGDDLVIDARDLRDILGVLCRKEFRETNTFSIETCRTLINITTDDESGVLDFEQTAKLWDEVMYWKQLFHRYDKDNSGSMETWELRNAFKTIGFRLSYPMMKTVAIRYGGKDRTLFFDDFIMCLAKTVQMYNIFQKLKKEESGDSANIDLETDHGNTSNEGSSYRGVKVPCRGLGGPN